VGGRGHASVVDACGDGLTAPWAARDAERQGRDADLVVVVAVECVPDCRLRLDVADVAGDPRPSPSGSSRSKVILRSRIFAASWNLRQAPLVTTSEPTRASDIASSHPATRTLGTNGARFSDPTKLTANRDPDARRLHNPSADAAQLHSRPPVQAYVACTKSLRHSLVSVENLDVMWPIITVMPQPTLWNREEIQRSPATAETGSRSLVTTEISDRARRIRIRLLRRRLDAQIAAEAPPPDSVDIQRRCAELTARGSRICLASALANILAAAEERRSDPASALILDHEAVLRERDQIEALIDRLRGSEIVSARGVALVRLLVHDSRSPFYQHRDDRALHDLLAKIAEALWSSRASG
jgi:hypothetical protein